MGLLADPAPCARNQAVRDHVRLALGIVSARPNPVHQERRRETRHAYPYPVRLTPVDSEVAVRVGEDLVVIAKHLSELGIDFYYGEPVPHRRVIASLPSGADDWIALLLELTWCRFGVHTWYENGGRFLQPIRSPAHLAKPVNLEDLAL